MRHSQIAKFTLFFILGLGIMHESLPICRNYDEKVLDLKSKTEFDLNLIDSFNRSGEMLGKGNFGKVKLVDWPSGSKVAVKETRYIDNLTEKEINAMHSLGKSKYFPELIACVKSRNGLYYIVMEYVKGDNFEAQSAIDQIKFNKGKNLFKYAAQLFLAIRELNNVGYAHNDIKPANIMLVGESIKIVDLGFADRLNALFGVKKGSPLFRSPGRFGSAPYSGIDDMYSAVLTIAYLISSHQEIFYTFDNLSNQNKELPNSCFSISRTIRCRNAIFANLKKIFENAGFGTFKEEPVDLSTINLTTLFSKIYYYESLGMKFEDIMKVIDRYINEWNFTEPSIAAHEEDKINEFKASSSKLKIAFDELEKEKEVDAIADPEPESSFIKMSIASKYEQIELLLDNCIQLEPQENEEENLSRSVYCRSADKKNKASKMGNFLKNKKAHNHPEEEKKMIKPRKSNYNLRSKDKVREDLESKPSNNAILKRTQRKLYSKDISGFEPARQVSEKRFKRNMLI
jgi:serine/threonine protein kinase